MALILRIDIDKPYGNNTFFRKVISKLREDYYFPIIKTLGYLDQTKGFATILHEAKIPAIFYFRNCTAPDGLLANTLINMGHAIGLHAENTRSLQTFTEELNLFKSKFSNIEIHSFSKHGSGYHKLGKNHYAPYEEEKYREWAEQTQTPYYFGNGMLTSFESKVSANFYQDCFWLEGEYRDMGKMTIEKCVEQAKIQDIPLLIHPENYYNRPQTKKDFDLLIRIAKDNNVDWKIDFL